jgi:uncharacterized lipoprotein
MKTSKIVTLFCCAFLFLSACDKKENSEQQKNIDTSVVGKDNNPAAVRSDIEMSDEVKQSVPGVTGDSLKSGKGNEKGVRKLGH